MLHRGRLHVVVLTQLLELEQHVHPVANGHHGPRVHVATRVACVVLKSTQELVYLKIAGVRARKLFALESF
jgi:hypothetical protein